MKPLPHNEDAEKRLLAGLFLGDPSDMDAALAGGITPESFFDHPHAAVFRAMQRIHAKGESVASYVVAHELTTTAEPAAAEAAMQISGLVPTTLELKSYVRIVRDLATVRATLRAAASMIEEGDKFSGDAGAFVADAERRFRELAASTTSESIVTAWADRRAGFGRVIKDDVPTVHLRDTPIFNRGNLGMITALKKSGKSAAAGAILGAIIGGEHVRGDTFGFRATNTQQHAVVHIDSEQSPADHEALIATAKRRADVEALPTWFHSYGCKGVSAEQLRRALPKLLAELKRAHGGVYLVLIDGVGDLVADPNDQLECNPLVSELEALTTLFNCSVVCVLHLNPSLGNAPSKSRGHLGSQLERKVETDLRLVQDADGITTMFTACARHAPIVAEHGPRFNWDNRAGMHLSLHGTNHDVKDAAEREALSELAADCFAESGSKRMRYGELVELLKKTAKCAERSAQLKVQRMKKLRVINEVPPRLYEIAA